MSAQLKAQLRHRLEEARARTIALIAHAPPETLLRARVTETWTARDVLAHLALSEADHRVAVEHQEKARQLAADGFDLDRWNAERLAEVAHLGPEEILARMAHERATTLVLLDTVPEKALRAQSVFHPVFGELALGKIFRIIAYHERLHASELARALNATP
ncbi:MAG: DinB family protein [Ardenticatenia bacterium]|nr:DinB family protein [Ardenticatenia bacterium]